MVFPCRAASAESEQARVLESGAPLALPGADGFRR